MNTKLAVKSIHSVAFVAIIAAAVCVLPLSCNLSTTPDTNDQAKNSDQPKSSDSSLSALTLSDGTLSPVFASATTS